MALTLNLKRFLKQSRGLNTKFVGIACPLILSLLCPAGLLAEEGQADLSIDREVATTEQANLVIEQLGASGEENDDISLAVGLYRQALEMLAGEESARNKAEEYQQIVEHGPSESQQLRNELDGLKHSPNEISETSRQWESQTIQELEQELSRRKVKITDIKEIQREIQDQIGSELNRPDQVRRELADAGDRLRNTQDEFAKIVSTGGRERVFKANRFQKLAERQELEALLKKLQLEGVSAEIRKGLLNLRESVVAERLSRDEKLIDVLQGIVDRRKRVEAKKTSEAAEAVSREAIKKHPLVRDVAEENSEYGKQLADLTTRLESVNAKLGRLAHLLTAVERDYDRTSQQLAVATSSQILSEILNKQSEKLSQLVNAGEFANSIKADRRASGEARLDQFRIDEDIQLLGSGETSADALIQSGDRNWQLLSAAERSEIRSDIEQLLEDRNALLVKLDSGHTRLVKALADLSHLRQQILEKAAQFSVLLHENLWWLPSNPALGSQWSGQVIDAVKGIRPAVLATQAWKTAQIVWRHNAGPVVILLLAVIGLLVVRRRLKAGLIYLSHKVHDISSDRYMLTAQALLITVLLAMPWALLIVGIETLLVPVAGMDMETVVGRVFHALAVYLFAIGLLQYACTEKGLAETHFNRSRSSISILRSNLSWWVPFTSAGFTVIAITLLRWPGATLYRDTAGLVFFVISMVAFSVFIWRISHSMGKPGSGTGRPDSNPIFRLLFACVALIFMVLAIAPLFGYLYTSIFFAFLLVDMLLVGAAGYLVYNLAIRWLRIAEKKLARRRMEEMREVERKKKETAAAAETTGEVMPLIKDDMELDLRDINLQTVRVFRALTIVLVGFGIFWVWHDFFPVYRMLEGIVLWQKSVGVTGSMILVPITLADGLLSSLVFVLTLVAARNVPGLLEISLLTPMNIKSGNRYAISSIVRYLIYGGGFVFAAAYLGLSWQDVQWLVAAMGIGLGFGLKEIFANFISGLIILFERPVRLGDVVTIDGLSGSVARIRIRATTIVDWDNRELIVPNQKLITESLINWTLSEQATRVTFAVGIAYGSDAEKAHQIMMDVVKASPLVLDEPESSVFFTGFGESSLDFQVRVFVKDLANRLPLKHELHINLEKSLRENGIEIPFPQRDLHLRSVSEGVNLAAGKWEKGSDAG